MRLRRCRSIDVKPCVRRRGAAVEVRIRGLGHSLLLSPLQVGEFRRMLRLALFEAAEQVHAQASDQRRPNRRSTQ